MERREGQTGGQLGCSERSGVGALVMHQGPAARVHVFSAGTGGGKKPETLRRLASISCF